MTDPATGYDAGDRTHVSERHKRRRLQSQHEDDDLVWLMNQHEGRRFLWRLLQSCHLYETSFIGMSATFFREGERNVDRREVLGMTVGHSEAGSFWAEFLRSLARLGLRGVKLVVSHAHS